jgi:hypothetical protein
LPFSQAQVILHTHHFWLLQIGPFILRDYADLVVDWGWQKKLMIHNQHVLVALKLMEDAMTLWTWQ